jgi:hypothetical protein
MGRFLAMALGVAAVALGGHVFASNGVEGLWQQTHWGESSMSC